MTLGSTNQYLWAFECLEYTWPLVWIDWFIVLTLFRTMINIFKQLFAEDILIIALHWALAKWAGSCRFWFRNNPVSRRLRRKTYEMVNDGCAKCEQKGETTVGIQRQRSTTMSLLGEQHICINWVESGNTLDSNCFLEGDCTSRMQTLTKGKLGILDMPCCCCLCFHREEILRNGFVSGFCFVQLLEIWAHGFALT